LQRLAGTWGRDGEDHNRQKADEFSDPWEFGGAIFGLQARKLGTTFRRKVPQTSSLEPAEVKALNGSPIGYFMGRAHLPRIAGDRVAI